MTSRLEFSGPTKRKALARAEGRCQDCGRALKDADRPQYHHILEARLGGDNGLPNCRVLCIVCHKGITAAVSVPRVSKMKRQADGAMNTSAPKAKIAQRVKPDKQPRDRLPLPPRRDIYGRPIR